MIRPRLRLPAVLALFLGTALPLPAADVPRGPSHEPVPYVYNAAAWKAVPRAFLEDGPACVLYAGANYVVEPDGTVEQIAHEVTRLNSRRGVELLGEFRSIAYDPSYQKLTLNVARVHKADGRVLDVGPQYTLLRDLNTDYQVLSRARQLVISFPELAAGDVIEVKWSLRGKDPEGHGQFYGAYNLGSDDYPMVHDELRILLPRGRTLRASVRGGKADPTGYEDEEARLYHWQVRMRPPPAADTNAPSKEEQRLRVFYSTFASWDEVADWCRKVRKGCWECTPEVGRIAREVTKGMTDDEDKARALTYWVRKNLRYLSLHDRDSWAPLAPQRVVTARYGDCKDQSQLLAVMLREAGVKAGVAIISWADNGDILESFPSPRANHAIVLVTVNGQDRWIDPVFSHAAWDVLVPEDCDRLCFVMDEKGPVRLVRTPKLRPEQNRVEQTTKVKVTRDGSAHCEREVIHRGVAAARERDSLLSATEAARKERLLPDLQEFHAQARITKLTIDPRSLEDLDEPVRLKVEFDVPKEYLESMAHLSDLQVYYHLLAYRAAPGRKLPLAAGHPAEVKHRFIVELAPGYRLTAEEEGKKAKSAWGSFVRTGRMDKGSRRFEVQTHLVLEKTRVEPGELAEFTKFHKEVQNDYFVWVSRNETTDLADAPLLETEVAAAPTDAELTLLLARLYRANNKPSDAIRVLRAGVEKATDERLARTLLEVADEQEKEAKVGRGRAHWQLARTAFERDKPAEALGHITKAGESDPTLALTTEVLDLKGRVCEKLGKAQEATTAYQTMLNLDPNDQRALSALVGLALAAKDRPKAMGYLRRYTVAVGSAAPGLATAADFHLRLDRLDDALELAAQSNHAAPSAAAERVLGLAHLRRGDTAEAAAHLSAALDRTPDKTKPASDVLEGLIRVRLAQGDLGAAEALAKTAGAVAELKPLCATLAALAQRRAALLKEIKAPADKAARAVERAVCAEQAHADGRTAKEVEALLSAALADGVEVGPALALRGLLGLERGRLAQALADAERAVALSPNEARGYYVRGRVRQERGDGRALADLERAAALGGRQDTAAQH
jgi:tetratricopeptide (TPR) repeat protein